MTQTSTLVVPPAIWRTPRCPVCAGVLTQQLPTLTNSLIGWDCHPCGLGWSDPITPGGLHRPQLPRCGMELAPFEAGINRQPAYRGAVYRCIRPQGHTSEDPPGHLCAGLLVAGSDGIPRSRTWRAELAVAQ